MHDETYIELSRGEVTRRARWLWRDAGCPAGRDLEYWLQAEVELLKVRVPHLRRHLARGTGPASNITPAPILRPVEFEAAKPELGRNGSKWTRAAA